MVYGSDLKYANHRGFTTFAAYQGEENLPTATALIEIRLKANAIVNVAFHNSETDSTVFLVTLEQYEMMVMDRIISNGYKLSDKEEQLELLTPEEFQFLRNLGDSLGDTIKSISMYDKTSPFVNQRGILR